MTEKRFDGTLRWGDEGYIMRHLEELRTRWSEAHNRWIKADLYYNRRFSVWPQNPEEEETE